MNKHIPREISKIYSLSIISSTYGLDLGNKNKVHAIKFVAAGTIEERIIDLLEIKQDYFEEVVEGAAEKRSRVSLLEILDLES